MAEAKYQGINVYGMGRVEVGDTLYHVTMGMKPVKVVRVYDGHFVDVEPEEAGEGGQ